jgi:uncharacterized protein (UPF0276 family)
MERLGTGIGWRPEIAGAVAELPGLDWVEVVAENICLEHLPEPLVRLRERGTTLVPHGVSLGLGGADRPDPARLTALAERAEALDAPLVTEHIAFVRAGGPLTASPRLEAGHLLPVPRTRDALDILCENVRIAQEALPVPLALENIAALIAWPEEEFTEGQFLTELVERTGVRLLIDVANLHTNHLNRGEDPSAVLDGLPVETIAYAHVAGGFERDGVWHDSHAHPVPQAVWDILAELCARTDPPGVLLERDENFPAVAELAAELEAVREVVDGRRVRKQNTAPPGTEAPHTGLSPSAGNGTPGPAPTAQPVPQATSGERRGDGGTATEVARQRVALAQAALLSALVAGTPAPEGFDRRRLRVQSTALAAKRADVVAKVAPELPGIIGSGYRQAFLSYTRTRSLSGGHRRDALDFAEWLLARPEPSGSLADAAVRWRLDAWWRERSGPVPPMGNRWGRLWRTALRAGSRRADTAGHHASLTPAKAGPAA